MNKKEITEQLKKDGFTNNPIIVCNNQLKYFRSILNVSPESRDNSIILGQISKYNEYLKILNS